MKLNKSHLIIGSILLGVLGLANIPTPEPTVYIAEASEARRQQIEAVNEEVVVKLPKEAEERRQQALADFETDEYVVAEQAKTDVAVAIFKEEVKAEEVIEVKEDWQNIKVENRTTEFQAGNLDYNERLIIEEAVKQGITSKEQVCYILATAKHESAGFKTLVEYADGSAYEGRLDLGNIYPGDGVKYKGRGYIQTTGRQNYEKYSELLAVNLIDNPELVSQNTDIAVFMLVEGMRSGRYTGHTLDMYIGDSYTDYWNSRRIVNGTDVAQKIADQAVDYCNLI